MVVGIREFTLRTGDGSGKPVLDGEELMHVQPSVTVILGNHVAEFPGTLYITSRKLIWLSDVDMKKGYAVDFLSIPLHAISRDPDTYSSSCIYAQIETLGESNTESTEVLDLPKIREMRLVPSDSSQLDTLFDIFCKCAELNLDPIEGNIIEIQPTTTVIGQGEESEQNWVISADPMVVHGGAREDEEWQTSKSVIGQSNEDEGGLSQPMIELQLDDPKFKDAEEIVPESETKDH